MKILTVFTVCMVLASLKAYSAEDIVIGVSRGEFRKVGSAGSQFLKIGAGARATAMAGAFGAVADDATALFWNPAGIGFLNGVQANFTNTQWFGGYQHNFAGAVIPVSEQYRVGASFTNFSSGAIPITTIDNDVPGTTTYSIADYALGLTFGGLITEQFSAAVTAKYVQNSMLQLNANALAVDIGTMYNTGVKGVRLAFSIHNLGGQMSFQGADLNRLGKTVTGLPGQPFDQALLTSPFNMPLVFRASVAGDLYDLIFDKAATSDAEHKWTGVFDFETTSDVPEQFTLGTEYTWNNLVTVRGGYRMGHDVFNIAGGLGLRYISDGFNGQIDYAIQPMGELGLINRFTVALQLP